MQSLIFPPFDHSLSREGDALLIWDVFREKNILLTPEEWVRQHLGHYLVSHLDYPKGRIHLEGNIKVLGMKRRFDVLVYDAYMQPLMIAECKAPEIDISNDTLRQVSHYNLALKVPYLLVTNGKKIVACRVDLTAGTYSYLQAIPEYQSLLL